MIHWGWRGGSLQPPPLRTPRRGGFTPCTPMPAERQRRDAVVPTRVSRAELAEWRAKAAAAGTPLSELVRQAMRRTRAWTAAATEAERERTRQIARIGNNLNQIARWANTYKQSAEAFEVLAGLLAVERALADVAPLRSEPPEGPGDAH